MIGITGSTGFVGMFQTVSLIKMGLPVRILVRKGHPYATNSPKGVEVVVGDLQDQSSLDRFADGLSVCFHYAARASFKGDFEKFNMVNIQGTKNIIQACRNVHRLIASSTQSVALENRDIIEESEDHPYPVKFIDFYGQSKSVVEEMITCEHPGGTIIRPPWTWGVGDTNNLPTLIKPHLNNKMAFLGGGRNMLETIHVANFVHAAMLASQNDTSCNQIYFISDDNPVSLNQLINDQLVACGFEKCTRNIPKFLSHIFLLSKSLTKMFGSKSGLLYSIRTQTFSDEKIRSQLGYGSVIYREEGLKELSDWCEFVGGPKMILTGRRRGASSQLIALTWEYLMEKSVSIQVLIDYLKRGQQLSS